MSTTLGRPSDLKTTPNAAAFFYGTLMHPNILRRVIGHDGRNLQICPAVLQEYTRHQVAWADYPGILPYRKSQALFGRELEVEERCVRGTLVVGLSASDLDLLDVFEGNEYKRERVGVHPLEPLAALTSFSTSTAESLVPATPSPLPAPSDLAATVEAETYVYCSPSGLKAELWSFDDFVRNNAWKWVGSTEDREVYTEVDRRRGVPRDVSQVA